MLKGFVKIKSNRMCHRNLNGKVGEIFGWYGYSTTRYGVSIDGKDYEFYECELEEMNL